MREYRLRTRSVEVRSRILIWSLLTFAALGLLAALPAPAANAENATSDDLTFSAGRRLALGTSSKPEEAARVRVSETYGRLQLHFEANQGQTDPQVKFLSRGGRHVLFLTPTEAVIVVTTPKQASNNESPRIGGKSTRPEGATRTALRMSFLGANPTPQVTGLDELPGRANYFTGNDPTKWRTNSPTYAKVRYQDLYPGTDLVYYGNQRQLEYDFIVRPGADPSRILLGFQGADPLEVDAAGNLVLHTAAGPIRQRKPVVYQKIDGVRRQISGDYVLKGTDQVGFTVAAYDVTRPLVIDPVLVYSTYLGGSLDDEGDGIAVDASGNAYVTGVTGSTNFPTTAGAFDTTPNSAADAFVTKLNPTGSVLVYSTYLGGSNFDRGFGIAVDAAGDAYVTGVTSSMNFPTTTGAFDTTYNGGEKDAFVTKLNATGSALVYSTYLGGSGDDDTGLGIAVDALGSAYVTGVTSTDFPTTMGAFDTTFNGDLDAFVTKLNPAGSALAYSTYLGGSGFDLGFGIAVDALGNAYVTGITDSTNFPTTTGAFDTSLNGSADAFVAKLNPAGSALAYSTYLGGSGLDEGVGIAVDALGNAYVAGVTESTTFPTTAGAFDTTFNGGIFDAFVTKLNSLGSGLLYSTYLGGSGLDLGRGIAVDALGNAYVTGVTESTNFPTTMGAFDTTLNGVSDAFVTKLNPSLVGPASLVYSTYLGGSGRDEGDGIAVDAAGDAYVTGRTGSSNFPTTTGAFDTSFNGSADAFVTKIADISPPEASTPGCEVTIADSGKITAANGDTATFSGHAQVASSGQEVSGQQQYKDHGPVQPLTAKSINVLAVLCSPDRTEATIFGQATIDGSGSFDYRIRVKDLGEPGKGVDMYGIVLSNGYVSGDQTLEAGNVQITVQE
jgi:hypothetical protein